MPPWKALGGLKDNTLRPSRTPSASLGPEPPAGAWIGPGAGQGGLAWLLQLPDPASLDPCLQVARSEPQELADLVVWDAPLSHQTAQVAGAYTQELSGLVQVQQGVHLPYTDERPVRPPLAVPPSCEAAAVADNVVALVGTAGLGALLGALVGHWLGVRRERRSQRRTLIASWRAAVLATGADYEGERAGESPIVHTPEWLTLRRHVPEALRDQLEATTGVAQRALRIGAGSGAVGEHRALLEVIDRLEKRWKLP